MNTVHTKTLEEFKALAEKHARELTPHGDFARVITLSGDLGAGKTTYAQAFAKALAVRETVTSPTFVIYKAYDLLDEEVPFDRLVHVDAYRLQNPEELRTHGFDALLHNPSNVILCEWPENVAGLFSIPHTHIAIKSESENERTLTYEEIL